MPLQHLRSSTAHKRPIPTVMSAGQIAINTNEASPALFFKDSNGDLVKVGPVHVGTSAPNSSPASVAATALVTGTVYQILTVGDSDFTLVGASANTVGTIFTATGTTTGTGTVSGQQGVEKGEQWLDTTGGTYVLKIYDGTDWRSESGTFVDVSGDTMTGDLVMNNANIVFEGATADDFETTLTVTDPTADRTITLPNVTGTVVTTGDTGSVTSTMIADGTIVNADINASAAIAGTKIDPDFGSQTIETTGVFSAADGAAATPSITFTGDTNTGIYRPGADQLAISTNGTQRINIEADGDINIDSGGVFYDATNNRLAIGTTSPSVKLHADGTGIEIRASNNANSKNISLYGGTSANDPAITFTDALRFYSNSASVERMRIDSSGRLLVGTSSARSNTPLGVAPAALIERAADSHGNADLMLVNNSASGYYPKLIFGLSQSTSIGSNTLVGASEALGYIQFTGNDGSNFVEAARIAAVTDGTPGSNDMPGRLEFSTTADGASSPTERMRITSNGRILIGTTTDTGYQCTIESVNSYAFYVKQDVGDATYPAATFHNTFTTGNNVLLNLYTDASSLRGSITYNRGGGVIAYNTTSDYRAKTILGAVENPGETIDALKVYWGVMNGANVERPMLVAHEVQEVAPYCVTGEKDAVDDDGSPIYQQMDHQVLVPLLIAEIQQLRARVAALEAS